MLTEGTRVGRDFQHLEDLVFIEGTAGVMRALIALEDIANGDEEVAIKWDGNPTIYWGREEDGTFVLVGKNGWGRNMSKSSEDLQKFIMNTGQGEDWRKKFSSDMAVIFDIMRDNTPADFRGYVYGDLLYHPGKPQQDEGEHYTFTPNQVEYSVRKDSSFGQRVGKTSIGVAVHSKFNEFGAKEGHPIKEVDNLNSGALLVLGQTYINHTPELDDSAVKEAEKYLNKYGKEIDSFLAPLTGLSDLRLIIYKFVNRMSRAQRLDDIDVLTFLSSLDELKVSSGKQAKIQQIVEQNPNALAAIFAFVKLLMAAKDSIIDQLDQAESDVTAKTSDQPGGEGYVAHKSKLKLVPRARWQPN